MSTKMRVTDKRNPLVLPDQQGAIVSFRGTVGFAWMGVRGGEKWFLTRRDAYEQDMRWAEVTEEELLERIGSELQILHQGDYEPAENAPIQWPWVTPSQLKRKPA